MEGLKAIPYVALVIAISGIVIGAAVITLGKFQDTVTTCANSTYGEVSGSCKCNASNDLTVGNVVPNNMTREAYAICQATESQTDVAEQLPTVAIIGIMVVIISIIAGVFVYLRYFA